MADDNEMRRREFLGALGAGATAPVAGCLGGDDKVTDNQNSTTKPTDSKTEPTTNNSESNTDEGSQGEQEGISRLLEEDETRFEKGEERDTVASGDGLLGYQFVEFHNPKEQLPEENIDTEQYPSLGKIERLTNITSDELGERFGGATAPYESGEDVFAHYITWRETEDGNTELSTYVLMEDGNGEIKKGSLGYVEQDEGAAVDADVENILQNVVEDVSDVSENLDDKYVEILLDKYD